MSSPARLLALSLGGITAMALCRSLQRIATREALELGVPPLALSFLPLLAATFLLLALTGPHLARRLREGQALPWRFGLGLGVVNVALPALGFTLGQQHLSATAASLFVAMLPVAITAMGVVFLGERLARRGYLGLAAALGGILLLLVQKGAPGSPGLEGALLGILYSSAAVVAAASSYVIIRRRGSADDVWALLIVQFFASAALLGGATLLLEPSFVESLSRASWGWMASLAWTNYILPQLLLLLLLRRIAVAPAALANYLTPIFTALLLALRFQEPISASVLISGLLVVGGAVLVHRASLVPGPATKEPAPVPEVEEVQAPGISGVPLPSGA